MPGRERERDRERDNAIGRSEFDRLQKGHEMLEAQVERVAAVAVRVASDAGEARADLQLVFFLQGRSRARVLETIAKYNDDKPGAPLGFFDPFGLTKDGDVEAFKRRRATELKNGRVAMLAAMGYITPEYVRFPGYCSPTAGLKFSEIPNGLAALGKVPAAGWTQIFLFLGLIEKGLFTYDPTRAPGDYKNAGVLGVPNGSTMAPGDGRTRKLNSELANGRLASLANMCGGYSCVMQNLDPGGAMMAIIGMFFQDGLTGSAWGDWASYTDSPLRAFENELGVQAPVGYWDPMGMSKDGDVKTFRRRREAELKNGRVAMFATMGFITPEYFRFSGYLSPAKSIKFADVPNGLAALGKVPLTGWIQIFLFCGMVDFGLYRPGPMSDAEGRKRKLNSELANGRLAMVAITGMLNRLIILGSQSIFVDFHFPYFPHDVFYFRDRFGCHRRCSCTFERLHLRWGACDVFSADQPFASHFCSNCGIYIYQGGCSKQNCLFSSGRCCSCCFDGYWQEGAVREHQTTAGFQVLSHHPHC
eukprot:g27419.t1